MELKFNNVSVEVGGKFLLSGACGSAKPGELLAIMGPSGAGKTTLLNTLAGRTPYTGVIALDGSLLNKQLTRKMCYVLQQEFFFGNLTLRETLTFTAMIRLPEKMPKEEKLSRMKNVVDALDLNNCLETIMGDMFTPGLSGGERKRASIACELLRDPELIFLDEPTTGLDSSTALTLIGILKTYAENQNKTVIASIHQPSSHLYFLFNKLLLLAAGKVAYFGSTEGVVDHFDSVGVMMDENYNPADFMLEILSESEDIRNKLVQAVLAMNKSSGTDHGIDNNHDDTAVYEALSDLDPGSVHMSLLDLEGTDDLHQSHDHSDDISKWPTGFCTQYTQLTLRTFRESRKRILDKWKWLENLLICSFVSLIFFQLPRNEETLRDRMGAVFFISAHWGFTPLFDAVTSFPLERMVINKERAAGWYRLSAYYCAKMTSELVLILVQPAVFIIIAYWVVGLNGISAFFATLGTVFIDSIAGQSFGLFVGIACLDVSQSMTVSITFQMGIMLLGGLFTRTLPVWLDWLKYLSFLHYTFDSLMVLEFTGAPPVQCMKDVNSTAFTVCKEANQTHIPSGEVLQYYDISWSYWQYILPLIAFALIFRTLGYITLRFFRKPF